MPRNGAGTYNPPASTWNPGVNGVTATTADYNAQLTDISAAITQSVSKDGQTPMTGNLPMGNNKITGLAAGTANTDAINFTQQTGRLLGIQTFTANGTYTPTTGTIKLVVRAVGGGGAGGGTNVITAGNLSIGAGGGAGAYVESLITSWSAGAPVVIGAAGISIAAAIGGSGGATTFSGISAGGGVGGGFFANAASGLAIGGIGGIPSGGFLSIPGMNGNSAGGAFAGGVGISGQGASGPFGGGGRSSISGSGGVNGVAATGYGAGGGGAVGFNSGSNAGGGAGTAGILVIYEYA